MAKFILKIKRDETHREGDSVTIGSRASCSFSISDPLVAEEHCLVLRHGDGYILEDLGTSLGTYVNGLATKGRVPLADGAVVVLGVTRFVVGIDAESGDITFDNKGAFYYDDKKDALDWSRKEVAFGQFLPVRRMGWIVVFTMILLAPFCYLIPATSERILDLGPTYHSGLPGYHQMLLDLPEGDRDCSACHDPMNSTPSGKCMACHAGDIDVGHHAWNGPGEGALADDEDSCRACHIDHRGTKEMALIHIRAEDSCERCHDEGEDLSSAAVAKRPVHDLHVDVGLAYNTFSHADHSGHEIEPGRAISCQDCHVAHDPGSEAATQLAADGRGRSREFAVVDYAACLKCHGEDGASVTLEPAWHGTEAEGKHCLECHGELNAEPLTQTPAYLPTSDRGFAFTSRPHDKLHESFMAGSEDACSDCHKADDALKGGAAMTGRPFEHITHIINPAPAAADCVQLSGEGRGGCSYCHEDVARADALATLSGKRHPLYGGKSCAECHTDTAMTRSDPFTVQGTRNDFPHSTHLSVEGGCFACHQFPEGDGYPALPVTPDDVKDCTKCHEGHANVGLTETLTAHDATKSGSCASCHREGDPVYAAGTVAWSRWTDSSFRHFSRGHRDLTNGKSCVECHGAETWNATTIAEVPIPTEREAMCLECHVDDKTRFHWR